MTTVTAKVHCSDKRVSGQGDATQATLTFRPDYQDGRNKEWAAATPSLSLSMTVNGRVADYFEQGDAYALVFQKE